MSMSQRSSAASAQRRPYDSTPFLSHARSGDSALETDATAWLEGRRERLHDRLREVRAKLAAGRLEGVRLENSRLKITPYDPLTPPAGERLDRALDALMPRIRITDLLWDVNARTGFLDAFTDLRSGRVHSNPTALLAAILAGATNLGLERMAHASRGVSHAQLSWASAWYLRSETYADALARIIDAHHALPFSTVWGSASRTSSTGSSLRRDATPGDQREIRTGPGPQDLLLPVGALRLVPFQRDRGHRRRGAVRARRAGGKRSPIRPPCAPCRHWRRLRPRLRPVPPARSLVRASSAQLSRPPAGVLRQTWAVEGTRPPHGQADQRGGRARALERRLAADGQYQNRVRKAFGDAAQARRLPPAESPVSGARRDRAHRTHAVHARVDRKPAAAHGVPGGSQQGRGSTCPRPCRVRALPRPHPRPFPRRPAKNASWR